MPARRFPPVLDGHQDFLQASIRQQRDFLSESDQGHVDLVRAKRGGFGAAFASVFLNNEHAELNPVGYAIQQINLLLDLCDRSQGSMRLIRTVAELDRALAEDAFAAIMHFEGAEPVSPSLKELRVFYEAGLRSIGLVWSRRNAFGAGVQFEGDQPQAGLTEAGFELVDACNLLGIVLDVSHLNPAGFWDLARQTNKPFIASHSNARAIGPHPRNLDDDQIRAIAEKDGTIGINLYTMLLSADAQEHDVEIDQALAHFDYIIKLVGDRHVSIGTDLDGAPMPSWLQDAAHLPVLLQAFDSAGWTDGRIERVCFGNFRRVLGQVWRE